MIRENVFITMIIEMAMAVTMKPMTGVIGTETETEAAITIEEIATTEMAVVRVTVVTVVMVGANSRNPQNNSPLKKQRKS